MLLQCPNAQCGKENSAEALRCAACGTSLRAYFWLRLLPDYLFNQALDLALKGQFQQAERALNGALLFSGHDAEAQMLLAAVQALQGHRPAAGSSLDRLGSRTLGDPRLARLYEALQAGVSCLVPGDGEPPAQHPPVETPLAGRPATGTNKHGTLQAAAADHEWGRKKRKRKH